MLDAAGDGIISIDRAGTVLSVNSAVTCLLGYAAEEITGRNIADLMPEPFRSLHNGSFECCLARIVDHGREALAQHSDGRTIPIWLSIKAYYAGGEPRFVGVLTDMSTLRKQQQALSDSEMINRLTVDNAVIGIALTDLDGKWLRLNGALRRMLGYSETELMDLDYTRITHPDDTALDRAQVARLHSGEISDFAHEKRYVRKDGSVFWVRVHVAGVYDDAGRLNYYATQVVDIDAERVALAQKEELQQQIQAFLDHVPANITMKNAAGRYTLVNRKLADSLDMRPEDLLGKTIDALGFADRSINHLIEDEAHILRTGEIIEREVSATWDHDCVLWATRFPVLDAHGTVTGTGSISTDITQLKRNETELLVQARTIGLLQHVAVAVNEAERSQEAMVNCLKLLCQYMDWSFGHVLRPDAGDGRLESTDILYALEERTLAAFRVERSASVYARGEGVPGRAWHSGRPEQGKTVYPRTGATGPLAAQLAFPIIVDGKVVAVFECYSARPIVLDDHLLDLIAFIDAQIGHAIDRETAKRETAVALERLSYHINNSAVGVIQVDRNLRFTEWSPQCEQIFGWRAEEVIGKHYRDFEFIHPDDEHFLIEAVAKFDDPQFTVYNLFYRNISKSGRVLHVDWYNSILRGEDGELISNLAIAVDRTAEVEARQALTEERNLFVSGPVMVFRWRDEPGWPIEYASPNVAGILGYDPADFVSGKIMASDCVHAEDALAIQRQIDEFRTGTDTQLQLQPFRMLAASGKQIWLQSYASIIPGNSAKDHFVAYAIDITHTHRLQEEARLQEARLGNVIEGTNAGIWEWNVASGETVCNQRWAEICGYTLDELEPVNIETWRSLIHPDDLAKSRQLLRDHFAGRADYYDLEARMRHKNGHWVWVHDRGKVVERAANGKPLRIAGTHMDIDQRKRDEAQILEANEALRKSNVELEQFAYVASHDLQEPLRMVAGFTQLLQKNYHDKLDDKAQEYIDFAVDGAQRMQQLIKDLLSYSRLGRQDIENKAVDMDVLLARVIQSLQLSIEEAAAKIVCDNLPTVRGDAGQLQQLMQNLIGNAIKYRGEGEVAIEVGTLQHDGQCVFFVRDNGIGIDTRFAERVFEIFQRLHTRNKYAGTGIGLSICKRIVERHGGRIWVESNLGEGAAFFFTLAPDRVGRMENDLRTSAKDQRSVA